MRSASLGKKILCIFMVDFSIDPRAQTLGPPLIEVDFPQEQLHLTGLERVKAAPYPLHPSRSRLVAHRGRGPRGSSVGRAPRATRPSRLPLLSKAVVPATRSRRCAVSWSCRLQTQPSTSPSLTHGTGLRAGTDRMHGTLLECANRKPVESHAQGPCCGRLRGAGPVPEAAGPIISNEP